MLLYSDDKESNAYNAVRTTGYEEGGNDNVRYCVSLCV